MEIPFHRLTNSPGIFSRWLRFLSHRQKHKAFLSFPPFSLPPSFSFFCGSENLLELQRGNAAASRSLPRPASLHCTSSISPSSSGAGSGAGPAAETNPAGRDSPVSAAWGVAVGPAPAAAASVLPVALRKGLIFSLLSRRCLYYC